MPTRPCCNAVDISHASRKGIYIYMPTRPGAQVNQHQPRCSTRRPAHCSGLEFPTTGGKNRERFTARG